MSEETYEREWFLERCELDRSRTTDFLDSLILPRFQGTHSNLAQLSGFRSSMVDRFVRGISVAYVDDRPKLVVDPEVDFDIKVLKELTTLYVIERPAVQTQRYGQRRIVRTLFEIYLEEGSRPAASLHERRRNLQVFPPLYQERLEFVEPGDLITLKRTIADLISSMAETQVVDTFQKLTGLSMGSVVDPII